MKWLNKLERKLGRFAIRGLMNYIIGFNVLVLIFAQVDPSGTYLNKIMLIPELVLQGEVWRLLTYIFIPPTFSIIWAVFVFYLYYLIGNSLEHEWGSFKFNIYYLVGVLATTAGAFLSGLGTTSAYLNLSLYLAFARLYPDFEIAIWGILPVKIKYLAWLNWAYIGYTVIFNPLPYKVAALASLLNFFLFFGKDIITRTRHRRHAHMNQKKFKSKLPERTEAIHKCSVCGITEKDDPMMEFRYCSKCAGDYEYCEEHLRNHEHVTK